MAVDPKILDRIKKCLALSTSSSAGEAAAALAAAQKLMTIHGVSETTLKFSDFEERTFNSNASATLVKTWENRLMFSVASAFGCKLMYVKGHSAARIWLQWKLIGQKGRVEIAEHTAIVLLRRLAAARAEYVKALPDYYTRGQKVKEGEGFAEGWTREVAKIVTAYAASDAEKTALVEYFQHKYPVVKMTEAVQNKMGANGLYAGLKAGGEVRLFRPTEGPAAVKSLGVS